MNQASNLVANLCGFAALRETSAKEFFTPRRQDAKKRSESRDRLSVPNLSGFASLRETSATRSKRDFTPKREGAKKEDRINLWLV
jgi:hypothetical protein